MSVIRFTAGFMKHSKWILIAALGAGVCASMPRAQASEERREEKRLLDLEKDHIEREEVRRALEKEIAVAKKEDRVALVELRERFEADKEKKIDHLVEIRTFREHHAEAVDHLLEHIRLEREEKERRR